jgi:GDPmannose 4,6-dehydratase
VRALITGVTGQDGSYLAELLLQRGWEVFGLVRRLSLDNHARIEGIRGLQLVSGDLLDAGSILRALKLARPDHIYNLAAQSFVPTSWEQPVLTGEITGLGAVRVLEAVREHCPAARVYQAGSSEMFGASAHLARDERTPFHPLSPYAAAKVYAHHMAVHYREAFGLHVVAGILFNHESPRRAPQFVTRHIARGVAAIHRGDARTLPLGNLEARRDWGWAPDYVAAIHAMLSREAAEDFVVATGVSHSVREFADLAFRCVGLRAEEHVVVDAVRIRPVDIPAMTGDSRRARDAFGWVPTVGFESLVERMVRAELDAR